jgi:chromosome segregation ATPase
MDQRAGDNPLVQISLLERALQLKAVDLGLDPHRGANSLLAMATVQNELQIARSDLVSVHAEIKARRTSLDRDEALMQAVMQHQREMEEKLTAALADSTLLRRSLADQSREVAKLTAQIARAEQDNGEIRRQMQRHATSLEDAQSTNTSLRASLNHEKLAHDSILEQLRLERDMRVQVAAELQSIKGTFVGNIFSFLNIPVDAFLTLV